MSKDQKNSFDVIIVGAGPAGVNCALWLKQLGFAPVVIDKQSQCGGLQLSNPYTNTWIATSTDTYGADVARAMHKNMVRHKVDMRLGYEASSATVKPDHVSVIIANGETLTSRFLVLATGVVSKTGGFINRIGMMVGSGPAIANTNFDGARIAILGGGDSAFENYAIVKDRGADSIRIFARSIKARADMLNRALIDDVVIGDYVVDSQANTVNGDRFDHILVFYGYEAGNKSLLGLDLAMRPNGFVSTDRDCLTSNPNVYAIGEIAARAHPCCVTAMADGVVSAKALQRRLESSTLSRYTGLAKRAASFGSKVFL